MFEATYQVRISGTIPAELMAELRDLTVTVEPPETVLHGSLPDQSAVVGLISRIHGLGLRLIEVRRLQPDEGPPPGPDPPPAAWPATRPAASAPAASAPAASAPADGTSFTRDDAAPVRGGDHGDNTRP